MKFGLHAAIIAVLLATALSVTAGRLAAQRPQPRMIPTDASPIDRSPEVPWASLYDRQLFYVAANMTAGAISAVVQRVLAGPDADRSVHGVATAALGGVLGGLTSSAGFAVLGTGAPAVRLVGLQTVAIGSSMVRNAGQGAEPGELGRDLSFVMAPFIIDYRRGSGVRIRVSAQSMYYLGCGFATDGARVDWGETAVAGTPVLTVPHAFVSSATAPCGFALRHPSFLQVSGVAAAGTVILPRGASVDGLDGRRAALATRRRVLPHEILHVAQQTRDLVAFRIPASDGLARALAPRKRDGVRSGLLTTLRGNLAALMSIVIVDPLSPTAGVNYLLLRTSPKRAWINSYNEREAEAFLGHTVCSGQGARSCSW